MDGGNEPVRRRSGYHTRKGVDDVSDDCDFHVARVQAGSVRAMGHWGLRVVVRRGVYDAVVYDALSRGGVADAEGGAARGEAVAEQMLVALASLETHRMTYA